MNNLEDITDLIIPEESPSYFTVEESLELYDTFFHLMEEFIIGNPTIITEEDFDDTFDDHIYNIVADHLNNDPFFTESSAREDFDDIFAKAREDFFKHFIPPRSYPNTFILELPDYEYITEQLVVLRNKPQAKQLTRDWYKERHSRLTMSNLYKCFESQSTKNQLIYEKCKPLQLSDENDDTIKIVTVVNTNTTLHWGHKYEPLSVMIYEKKYKTKIEDFGCIAHEYYPFLGASPDGINVDINSKRYGRMLEVKNIVNREIDGIPKKEYWIQMQGQMEVCDLDECDFLETKFVEYESFTEGFLSDTFNENEQSVTTLDNVCMSNDEKMKGVIIHFHTKDGSPFYAYKPLDIVSYDDVIKWEESTVDYYEGDPKYNYTFLKTIYWKLEEYSCVLVCRNRQWFQDNISTIKDVWNTIERERISGYEHRAPAKRTKKEPTTIQHEQSNKCLLHYNKDSGKVTVRKLDVI
jgi:putative phage-type endonuclease